MLICNGTVSGNSAQYDGGGINNCGYLTLSNSTISGNTANGLGRGIANGGTVTVTNSTISGNSTTGQNSSGGDIENVGTLTISSSTLSGNNAQNGGGIYVQAGAAILQNSIVTNSGPGGNCYIYQGPIISHGYNLCSDYTCPFNNIGDLNNTKPKLGPLQNNGGPTQTQALLDASPAIDAGNPGGCTDGNGNLLKTDQRGKPRPDPEDPSGCDMGAYERQGD